MNNILLAFDDQIAKNENNLLKATLKLSNFGFSRYTKSLFLKYKKNVFGCLNINLLSNY